MSVKLNSEDVELTSVKVATEEDRAEPCPSGEQDVQVPIRDEAEPCPSGEPDVRVTIRDEAEAGPSAEPGPSGGQDVHLPIRDEAEAGTSGCQDVQVPIRDEAEAGPSGGQDVQVPISDEAEAGPSRGQDVQVPISDEAEAGPSGIQYVPPGDDTVQGEANPGENEGLLGQGDLRIRRAPGHDPLRRTESEEERRKLIKKWDIIDIIFIGISVAIAIIVWFFTFIKAVFSYIGLVSQNNNTTTANVSTTTDETGYTE